MYTKPSNKSKIVFVEIFTPDAVILIFYKTIEPKVSLILKMVVVLKVVPSLNHNKLSQIYRVFLKLIIIERNEKSCSENTDHQKEQMEVTLVPSQTISQPQKALHLIRRHISCVIHVG